MFDAAFHAAIGTVFQAVIDYPNIDPVWFTIPLPFVDFDLPIRWYSLSYIAGILLAWWYMLRLIQRPGAPIARRHADDLVTWLTLGVILGGRVGSILFYSPERYFGPDGSLLNMLKLWEGGMSFHGGAVGVAIAMFLYARKEKLNWLRLWDYVACTVPFGLFFGRLANFVNGELYGRPADVPWAMVFPGGGAEPRHPSQLYEAGLEGIALFVILWLLFWKTDARYKPGLLAGTFVGGYGVFRFFVEFFRMPDDNLGFLTFGMTMGQWLCVPMILLGAYLIFTANGRRQRIEPISGAHAQQ
ncbi:prolipoprotein diacylglyceryl transferase [Pacificimonas sp. WHA3]|uniref:Phosphatidylglycerol--prolipoprotein diacylglyceryl transferase n=1 Tax=Pacificimonas pallii TaxID=2827236 RepID=A0ABS6SAX0_9SPHN|nr:prolipoprotein diacylglyceryl transferase [Pacificimonas pallii]MBV7255560.1 prolipoprotein diacylglyceryl transferase [Pacificimonas pallii]